VKNTFAITAVAALMLAACAGRADAEESKAARIEAGAKAPDFSASASTGGTIGLKDLKGKVVVLYFYPKDDTPGCTVEAKGFRDYAADFTKAGAVVLGVSKDDLDSHAKFVKKFDLTFALLADTDGKIHDAYGAWKQGSIFGRSALGVDRSTFVIDGDGTVRKVWHSVSPDGHAEDVLAFVKSLAPAK
jgi:peroxiredoxin Q/BCP